MISTRGDGKSLQLLRAGRQLGMSRTMCCAVLASYIEAPGPRKAKYLTPKFLRRYDWVFQ